MIGAVITLFEGKEVADTDVFGLDLGIRTGFAFLVGAACSMASGIIGMYIIRSNVRTAAAARRPRRGGPGRHARRAVSGFLVVALSLLSVYGIFAAFGGLSAAARPPTRHS